MTRELSHPLVCVVGPTASGKTLLAQGIAEQLGASVLSADSMQLYRGMDIGTGKIAFKDRTVPYYGLDLVDPGQPYSASLFQAYGRGVVDRLEGEGSSCVLCGGTGFYVRAVVDDFCFPAGEQLGNPVRDRYTRLLRQEGPQAVWNALNARDSASARIIPVNDSKRVIRALEMHYEGTSYADQKERFARIGPYYLPLVMIGLHVSPDLLAHRIEERVDSMVRQGLVDEVEGLLSRGYRNALTASQAIGYKELVSYLEGSCSFTEAIEHVKTASRRYAKRQRTWFRKDGRIEWIDADAGIQASTLHHALALVEFAKRGSS